MIGRKGCPLSDVETNFCDANLIWERGRNSTIRELKFLSKHAAAFNQTTKAKCRQSWEYLGSGRIYMWKISEFCQYPDKNYSQEADTKELYKLFETIYGKSFLY